MCKRPRLIVTHSLRLMDVLAAIATIAGSYALGFDAGPTFAHYAPQGLVAAGIVVLVKPFVYHCVGLYRPYWAYIDEREVVRIVIAVSPSSLVVGAIILGAFGARVVGGFPGSVLVFDWLFSVAWVLGVRVVARHELRLHERAMSASQIRRVQP